MSKQKVVIFGAGKKGKIAIATLKYEKEIIGIIDNDKSKWGKQLDGFRIYSLEESKVFLNDEIQIVIAVVSFAGIVLQLERNGLHNYVYFEDVYADDFSCKSREIMDKNVIDGPAGQFTGKYIKNGWMNHVLSDYGDEDFFDRIPVHGKILDAGSGCGTQLFHFLCRGYDAYGIDCCQWKLEFCRQKIEDFDFPEEWKAHILDGKGEKLPFLDEEFDAVTSHMVLEHVDDWRQCIREMLRVTKRGGIVRIIAPDYRNSYEEHYGIHFGKSLMDHKKEFKEYFEENNLETDTFNELNFISKHDILSELQKYTAAVLEIEDYEEMYPEAWVTRMDHRLYYRHICNFLIRKV